MHTLTKSNLDIGTVNIKENCRELLVEQHATIAHNGHCLYRVTRPEVDSELFPNINGFQQIETEPFILDSKQAIEIGKSIPKNREHSICNQAVVSQNGTTKIATTNLDSSNVVIANTKDYRYPNYNEVIPKNKDSNLKIALNVIQLEQICKLAKEFLKDEDKDESKDKRVILEIEAKDIAVKISTRSITRKQEFLAVLMPMTIEENDVKNYKDLEK